MGGLFERVGGTVIAKSAFGAIAPRFSGGLSALSSLLIIYVILRSNTKLSTIYHRIVFGMSCADVVSSIAIALTTLPMPKIDPNIELKTPNGENITQYAGQRIGTFQTCRAQGFLWVLGVVTMFGYNVTLCVYYACVIGFKMKEKSVKKKVEPFLHLVPLAAGIGSAIAPLTLGDLYNPGADPWCTIHGVDAALPQPKQTTALPIVRIRIAEEVGKVLIITFLVLTVSAFALIIGRIIYIGRKLNYISSRMRSPRSANAHVEIANRTHQNTKVILIQAAWYIFAFVFSLIFALVRFIMTSNYPFVTGGQFLTMPLQGFLNALIFFGHKVYNYRKNHPDVSRRHVFCLLLRGKAIDPILVSRISLIEAELGQDNNIMMTLEVSDENGEHDMLSSSPSVDHRDERSDDKLEDGDVFDEGLSYPSNISHQNTKYDNDACVDTDENQNLDGFSYTSSFPSNTSKQNTVTGLGELSSSSCFKTTNTGSSNRFTAQRSVDTCSSNLSFSSTVFKSVRTDSSNLSFSRSGGSNADSIQEDSDDVSI